MLRDPKQTEMLMVLRQKLSKESMGFQFIQLKEKKLNYLIAYENQDNMLRKHSISHTPVFRMPSKPPLNMTFSENLISRESSLSNDDSKSNKAIFSNCLVVSNEIQTRFQCHELLEKHFKSVQHALNTYEAHDMVISSMSCNQEKYDLILIDLEIASSDEFENVNLIVESFI